MERAALLFLVGAVFGSALDGLHTHSGTTSYPDPIFLRMAWWTPLLFGGAVLGLGGGYSLAMYRLGARRGPPPPRTMALACASFVLLFAVSAYLPSSNPVKLAVLLAGTAMLWRLADRTWQGAVLAACVAVFGVATEIFLTGVGAFTHHQADALGIPMWLPGLYLAAAPSLGQWARSVILAPAGAPLSSAAPGSPEPPPARPAPAPGPAR